MTEKIRQNGQYDKEMLRRLQMVELDILKHTTDAMDKNGIQYYLGYGTLLGAIRHHGFIPWDDDVDVFLPRPDFERFRELADQILPAPLFLNRDPMPRPICMRACLQVENPELQQIRPRGKGTIKSNVRIDIIPIDGAPKTYVGRQWLLFKAQVLYNLIRFPRALEDGVGNMENKSMLEKGAIWFNRNLQIGKHISAIRLSQRFDKLRRRYSYEKSEWVVAWTHEYGNRIFCRKEWFGSGKKIQFENVVLQAPVNSEAVLRQYYGDYMILPPERERVLKHIVGFEETQ